MAIAWSCSLPLSGDETPIRFPDGPKPDSTSSRGEKYPSASLEGLEQLPGAIPRQPSKIVTLLQSAPVLFLPVNENGDADTILSNSNNKCT